MHIPDGFLDAKTAMVAGAISVAGLGIALGHARKHLHRRQVPLLGLSAAFVFAAQMLNFPVAGGTSGHLVGGVLIAALLGPSAAIIVISSVLIVQCFMFADGGVTALGANVLNMGLVSSVVGWIIYALITRIVKGLFGCIFAATFAAWVSVVLAAILCAGELAASGTFQWSIAFPAMVGIHMLIGIGEGLITALVLVAIAQARRELVIPSAVQPPTRSYGALAAYGILITLGLALFVSPFASQSPDGLERTAADHGFDSLAKTVLPAPMPDYKIEALTKGKIGTSLAGAAGTLVVLGLSWLLARTLVPREKCMTAEFSRSFNAPPPH